MNLEYCKLVTVGGMDELRVPASLSQWVGWMNLKYFKACHSLDGIMNLEYFKACHSEWDYEPRVLQSLSQWMGL